MHYIYAYLLYHVGINKCPIIPKVNWSRKGFKEKQFWKDSYRLMRKYDAKNDTFLKKLSHQIDHSTIVQLFVKVENR